MRHDRLGNQPRPPSVFGASPGVRPPTRTPPLQLCRTLPQIQTPLPLQGLPAWPGGAVQGLPVIIQTPVKGEKAARWGMDDPLMTFTLARHGYRSDAQ